MRLTRMIACAAILTVALSPSLASAQTCSFMADPNDPACKSGTSGVGQAAGSKGTRPEDEKGMGQKVCAFVDTSTGVCRSLRPDTKGYDSAVMTGIQAAMTGIQIQRDTIYVAEQMGVLSGFGLGGRGAPLGQGSATPISTPPVVDLGVSPLVSVPSPGAPSTAGQGVDSSLVSCSKAKIDAIERAAGRAATPLELTSALKACGS